MSSSSGRSQRRSRPQTLACAARGDREAVVIALAPDGRLQPPTQRRLILDRQAQQPGDRAHRDRPGQRRRSIEPALAHGLRERRADIGPDRGLHRRDGRGREAIADDSAQAVVVGRVGGDEVAGPGQRKRVVG